jgi:hypothetical protein
MRSRRQSGTRSRRVRRADGTARYPAPAQRLAGARQPGTRALAGEPVFRLGDPPRVLPRRIPLNGIGCPDIS